jgi:DNA-binding NarL/FixJ family response regulator
MAVSKTLIRVLSVDDHPLVREGIAAVINAQPDMKVVAHATDGHTAIRCFGEHEPDVTLMDLRLPDMSGIEAVTAIRATFPKARIIMLTTSDRDTEIRRALAVGACSYVLKTMPPHEIAETIRQVHVGKNRIPPEVAVILAEHLSEGTLSERELEVLHAAAEGNRNRDIADRLRISEETVKVHMKRVMAKLGATDRTQAVTIALRRGLIQL